MSWTLHRIELFGFRDDLRKISFLPHANFFIGRNGTGKTRLIELIKSSLTFDYEKLRSVAFDQIVIIFADSNSNKNPNLVIKKRIDEERDLPILSFQFFESLSESKPSIEFSKFFATSRIFPHDTAARAMPSRHRASESQLRREFARNLDVAWLSIHRSNFDFPREHFSDVVEESFQFSSPVDRKLYELTSELAQYVSVLSNSVADLNEKFQRQFVLSFVDYRHKEQSYIPDEAIMKEKIDIESIFREFNFQESEYKEKLDNHFDRLKSIYARKQEIDGSPELDLHSIAELFLLFDTERLHNIVEDWAALQQKKSEITRYRDRFLSTLSGLFDGKSAQFSNRNVLEFKLDGERTITVHDLSSGEKQILIIYIQALMRDGHPFVFIADEPEISLHIQWQERLVSDIFKINPDAQLIFATHSPDIVGEYSNGLISLDAK